MLDSAGRFAAWLLTLRKTYAAYFWRLSERPPIDVIKRLPNPLPNACFFHAAPLPGPKQCVIPGKTTSGANDQGLPQPSQVSSVLLARFWDRAPSSASFYCTIKVPVCNSQFDIEAGRSADDDDRRRCLAASAVAHFVVGLLCQLSSGT